MTVNQRKFDGRHSAESTPRIGYNQDDSKGLDCLSNKTSSPGTAMTFDRITNDPSRMNGQPCIRNLRLTVRRVVEAAALYPDRAELRREYPELEDEDIRQALAYAAACVDDRVVELTTLS